MASAKAEALKSIISDANSARLGDKLPKGKRDRLKLLNLIKEELKDDDTEEAETESTTED